MGSLLRVDMTNRIAKFEGNPYEEPFGGRALIGRVALSEIDPECDPLGRFNKLIITTGPFAGTGVPCSGRVSIGGKSPLTGGIKEANAGGSFATKMGRLGISMIVIEGMPNGTGPFVLHISKGKAEITERKDLQREGVYKTAETLNSEYPKSGLLIIGPTGEMSLRGAGIAVSDIDGVPGRYAARGGMGAVMGSKGLKAVVIDDSAGSRPVAAEPEAFRDAILSLGKLIAETPQTAKVYPDYGTAAMVDPMNALGGLPTRNFGGGKFEYADRINGESLRNLVIERGGSTTHACMVGCPIKCSNILPLDDGNLIGPVEYETIGLIGSNCAIGSLDSIGKLNRMCNDAGLDTIETGAAIGVAMKAGLIGFGDAEGAANLIKEACKGTFIGRIIGNGAAITAKVLGVREAPVVKGQAMAAYEPRAVKGLGVTYATSPMGADHTAGTTTRAKVVHNEKEGQVAASLNAQIGAIVYDSLGLCLFVGTAIRGDWSYIVKLINSMCNKALVEADVVEEAKKCLRNELSFNKAAGLTKADDRLPEHFVNEDNPDSNSRFDIGCDELDSIFASIG